MPGAGLVEMEGSCGGSEVAISKQGKIDRGCGQPADPEEIELHAVFEVFLLKIPSAVVMA